jgi:diketogulonate reductase-like aldo/keto reductase
MILNETFALADGVAIPKLGLGTWRIDDAAAAHVVREAAAIGYRHFDTAQAYDNERGVGEGLRASGVARADLFVTTKLVAESKTYADARSRIDGSLQVLSASLENVNRGGEDLAEVTSLEGAVRAWRELDEAHRDAAVLTPERPVQIDGAMSESFVGSAIAALAEHLPGPPVD